MGDFSTRQVIEVKEGSITDYFSCDKAILTGVYPYVETTFANNIELIVKPKGKKKPIIAKVPFSGYFFQLFLGDFNGDGKDDIMIRGSFYEVRGYAIAIIYTYEDNMLKVIFTHEMFTSRYPFIATYLDGFMLKVESIALKEKYLIDMGSKPKDYLNLLYNDDGKVKQDVSPAISPVSEVYPTKSIYDYNYDVLIKQNVLGVDKQDIIATIHASFNLLEDKVSLVNMGILTFGKKEKIICTVE